jgi:hypothetical protein
VRRGTMRAHEVGGDSGLNGQDLRLGVSVLELRVQIRGLE